MGLLGDLRHESVPLPKTKLIHLTSEVVLKVTDVDLVALYGHHEVKLNLLRQRFPELTITSRGSMLKIVGAKKQVQTCKEKFEQMLKMLKRYGELTEQGVKDLLGGENPFATKLQTHTQNVLVHGRHGKTIVPRTKNQKALVRLSDDNDVVFAIGPAGTGKTYTAVALAVRALKARRVQRIILTRPAVEAGENLGFLPGDLKDKIDPYLRPLYDALDDMIQPDKLNHFMANRVIEIAPMAFMRGRTLDNAFIILDEAQNATETQLKMFLTRLGPTAKCIITGDLSQIDLPRHHQSGLRRCLQVLGPVDGIGVLRLTTEDVVRHRLVRSIIRAYDAADTEDEQRKLEEKAGRKAGKKRSDTESSETKK